MDLNQYVDQLHQELATAAAAGGEEARALGERLTAPLESATRLVLLEALSAAAGEITRDLAPGSVEVRLRGREPDFVVTPPEDWSEQPAPPRELPMPSGPVPEVDEAGGTSRITLRLPDHLKPRVEEAAGRMGLSVNAWLIRAASAALGGEDRAGTRLGRQHTGWVR